MNSGPPLRYGPRMGYGTERLHVDVTDGVAIATLANPPINLLTLDLFGDLLRFAGAAAADDDIRVVVLRSPRPRVTPARRSAAGPP